LQTPEPFAESSVNACPPPETKVPMQKGTPAS
jgi:hypothetical protein